MGAIFTCSIDDGHPSDLKMADLLARHGLTGTFYVPLANREGLPVMEPAQVRDLAGSFEIGSHTLDHSYLKSISDDEARRQVVEGKHRLEDELGQTVPGFCYPGGRFDKRHVNMVRDTGFAYARTTRNLCFHPGQAPHEMPTTIQFYPHGKGVYVRNFVSGGEWATRMPGLHDALRPREWTGRLYALFDRAVRDGSVFHLWCHSHDIDAIEGWQEMDRFLAYAATGTKKNDRLNNHELAARFFKCINPGVSS